MGIEKTLSSRSAAGHEPRARTTTGYQAKELFEERTPTTATDVFAFGGLILAVCHLHSVVLDSANFSLHCISDYEREESTL